MFATTNLVIASLFAAIVSECSLYELNKMSFNSIHSYGALKIVYDIMVAIIFQSIAEYYWHRMMHLPFFYKYFHKYHHFYKSPEPWDDMYIHPIEAIGYYLILYSPPFLFTCHIYAFLIYMIIMGICGVLDHSGIQFSFPFLYNTKDHDIHHMKFDRNYAFPFPFLDIIHQTYEGNYLGNNYVYNKS
jgi:sterol desaturase/sphingolipid hydroxylase (fatty acid hydroxylase superfamily)